MKSDYACGKHSAINNKQFKKETQFTYQFTWWFFKMISEFYFFVGMLLTYMLQHYTGRFSLRCFLLVQYLTNLAYHKSVESANMQIFSVEIVETIFTVFRSVNDRL